MDDETSLPGFYDTLPIHHVNGFSGIPHAVVEFSTRLGWHGVPPFGKKSCDSMNTPHASTESFTWHGVTGTAYIYSLLQLPNLDWLHLRWRPHQWHLTTHVIKASNLEKPNASVHR